MRCPSGTTSGTSLRALEILAVAEQDGRRPVEAIVLDQAGAATHARDLAVVTAALRPALVETLIACAAARQQVSVVHVDAGSFAGRRRAVGTDAAVLRLEAAGIAVAVLRRGDDLEAVLGGAESVVAHG